MLDGRTRCPDMLASAQDAVQDFLAADPALFSGKSLIAECFDAWQGEPTPAEKAIVAVQDYNGMADAALDHHFVALDEDHPEPSHAHALPIADYQVYNGRF